LPASLLPPCLAWQLVRQARYPPSSSWRRLMFLLCRQRSPLARPVAPCLSFHRTHFLCCAAYFLLKAGLWCSESAYAALTTSCLLCGSSLFTTSSKHHVDFWPIKVHVWVEIASACAIPFGFFAPCRLKYRGHEEVFIGAKSLVSLPTEELTNRVACEQVHHVHDSTRTPNIQQMVSIPWHSATAI
jgi:hypothetical protein